MTQKKVFTQKVFSSGNDLKGRKTWSNHFSNILTTSPPPREGKGWSKRGVKKISTQKNFPLEMAEMARNLALGRFVLVSLVVQFEMSTVVR